MVKKFFKNIKAKCKGFSLMELVVTIAIMAVLAAVLTPALIHYVEDSRAAKDNHAMTEVVNAMKVALAYDDVYDEVIDDITWKNSCYVDSDNPKAENIEYLFVDDNEKAYKSYIYKDAERELDETPYKFAGRMYGATVTFRPNNENVIEIKDGVYSGNDVQGKKISEMSEENILYTKIKQVIGNKIELTSATYKNSQYTIFICFGVEAKKTQSESKVTLSDEPIVIYGQWSGTNLLTIEMQDPALDDTPDFDHGKHDGIIPEGGSFESVNTFEGSHCCPTCGFDFEDPICWCGNCHYSDGYDQCDNCDYDFTRDPKDIWCYCGAFSQQDYLDSKDSISGSLGEGEAFPIVDSSDIYVYGDYTYIYNGSYYNEPYRTSLDRQFTANNSIGGWLVAVRDEAEASSNTYYSYFKQQDSYSMPLTSIGGKPVVSMTYCFYGHNGNIIKEVNLPSTLTTLDSIFWNSGSNNGLLRIEKLNFGGTKAQWAQLIQKYTYWTNGLDTLFTTVVHCADGDVCVNHNFVQDANATAEKYNTSQHKKKATCSKCGIDGYIYQSHSWDSNVQYSEYSSSSHYETKTCTICGQVYKHTSSHTYGTTYEANNNAQHYVIKTCTKCSYQSKTSESHSANSNSLWTYTNSTTSQHIINKKCTKCNLAFTSIGTHSAGSENSSWVYESTGHATQHTITSPCTLCSGSYVRIGYHSGSDSCINPQPCTKCKQTYQGYHSDVDWRVRSISDTEHVEEGYCDTCEQWHENYRSTHSANGDYYLGDYQTCTAPDSWVCYCGYQHIGTGNKTHFYRTAGCGTVSCVCGETTTQGTNHHIVGNTCSVCGLSLDRLSVSITQENVYTNNVDGMIVGSWNFEGASSVTITINGSCEGYDFVFFAEGNNHSPGLSTARKYLSTTGIISPSATTIPAGITASDYKFRNTQTNKKLTVDMPVGTIFWDTDGSVVNYPGFTITVTPHYS